MNRLQMNKQYMLRNLSNYLKKKEDLWVNESLVKDQITLFQQKKLDLEEVIRKEEQLSMPYQSVRDLEREEFAQKFAQLAGIVHSLYQRADNHEGAYLSKLSPKELMRNSLEQSLARAGNLLELSVQIQEEIDAHPTAKKCQADAQAQFDSFSNRILLPTERRKERKQVLSLITQKQDELLELLTNDLDGSMRVFETINPEFLELYTLNREVVQPIRRNKDGEIDDSIDWVMEDDEDFNLENGDTPSNGNDESGDPTENV